MPTQVVKKTEQSYDEVPYESYSHPQTHASNLYGIAKLFGLSPVDFKTAKVLEIGCAGGGNLFPQALFCPKASFTGIDLSHEQIALANRQKELLGIKNIDFRQQDVTVFDLKGEKNKYDYIICHGVFSWVPEEVRSAILDICREALKPEGIALISYNALPGWNAVRSVREMMMYHANRFARPEDKIKQARGLLDFLLENVAEGNAYRSVLESERKILQGVNDTYLYHEHLEHVNTQFYLHEFVRTAQGSGLEYVGDTAISAMYTGNMPTKTMEALKAVDDIVAQEQYMDFIYNRRFRSSILCKKGQKIVRNLRNEQIMDYFLAPHYQPEDPKADTSKSVNFKNTDGGGNQFATNDSIASTLFLELAASSPVPLAAEKLVERVAKKLKLTDDAPVRQALILNGMQLVLRGQITLLSSCPSFVQDVSKTPVVWAPARYQAGLPGCVKVFNVFNGMVTTNEVANMVMALLDGTRDVAAVTEVLVDYVNKGGLNVTKEGKPVKDGNLVRAELAKSVEELLPRLAAQYLLV
jgi:methyltransferase-like protein/SAM-dependent methyltransferase